ncbi:MAG TPA: SDR family oxidoreductase [Kofleriaceae bacterium]|nr:SDR family oxidoreductase [Kofleriaceae bacterium]
MEVAGKVIVVTGGAHGIGRALVERFEREGAKHVVAVDIAGSGKRVDVADAAAVAALVDEVERDIGPIELFCSNAGILPIDADPNNAASTPEIEWNRAWAVNVMAHVHAARALLPRMISRKSGYFLHTVSAAGLLSQIGSAAYSTTKHAAIGFAESLAITHKDHGIRVSVLCPQAVQTPMIEGQRMNGADIDGVITAEAVADATIEGLRRETFLILPHPNVATYVARKAENYDRWLGGMAKLRRTLL